MKTASTLALGLLGAASTALASDVTKLKQDTFDDFIKSHDLVLAEFFAPWCGHCKALAPEYEKAATALKDKPIDLVQVDCTEETDLCSTHGVSGYPTIKVYRGLENVAAYSGQRTNDSIVSYMIKQSLPPVTEVTTDKLDEFKKTDKVVLVAYYGADDKSSKEAFLEVAKGLRDDYVFGAVTDAATAKAEGVKQPAVVLYKTFDEGKNTFTDKFDKDKLTTWTKTSATPLVGAVGPDTYQGYMDSGLPLAYIFAEEETQRDELAKELKEVAEKYKGKINFATIDAKAFGGHAANLNLEDGKFPAFAIQNIGKNEKYPYDQSKKITKKDIGAFVADFDGGKIKPSVKSEPVPEKQDGPVSIVVAHNYKEIVMDDAKDVLIEFYAPWCGHCKALAPKYDELGAKYQADPAIAKKVTIAKVDATTNDVPDDIAGFPTIKLYPAGAKDKPVEYQGDRTIEDLIQFVKENGKHKIDVNDAKAASDDESASSPELKKKDAEAAEKMGKAAEAASKSTDAAKDTATKVVDKVKSAASGAAEAVASVVSDDADEHDEL